MSQLTRTSPSSATNNLYYHAQPNHRFATVGASYDGDYNLFYSTEADTGWWLLYTRKAGSLSEWQSYTSQNLAGQDEAFCLESPRVCQCVW